jgi:hypothetical protein
VKAQVGTKVLKDWYAILVFVLKIVVLLTAAALGGGAGL